MTISIRTPQTITEFKHIERLQTKIWGGDVDYVPAHILLVFAKEGGIVHLMVDDDQPIGFSFGFPALTNAGQLKLASHQAGVLPAYQSGGYGYRIKLAQRQAALDKNFKLITWTFDPLQGLNARLNLRKLGAVCSTYIPNLYGEMTDALNQGLPSDRFRVDWWLDSPHVVNRLADTNPEPKVADFPLLNPDAPHLQPAWGDQPAGVVEIPNNLNQLKSESPGLALQWRRHTRQIFETAFQRGYTALDMLRHQGKNYYLLQHGWRPN